MLKQVWIDVPENSVIIGLKSECPCGEGVISEIRHSTGEVAHYIGNRAFWHKLPEYYTTVTVSNCKRLTGNEGRSYRPIS